MNGDRPPQPVLDALLVLAAVLVAQQWAMALPPPGSDGLPVAALCVGALWLLRSHDLPRRAAPAWAVACLGLGLLGGALHGPTPPAALAPWLPAPVATGWAFAWVGVLAPAAEELYFRGALQPALSRRVGPLAVPLAAGAFGLVHLPGAGFVHGFALGLLFGAARHLTASLAAAIALHIGWNVGSLLHGLTHTTFHAWLAGGILLTAGAVAGAWTWAQGKRRDDTGGEPSRTAG